LAGIIEESLVYTTSNHQTSSVHTKWEGSICMGFMGGAFVWLKHHDVTSKHKMSLEN
jgi:hypothetical protein